MREKKPQEAQGPSRYVWSLVNALNDPEVNLNV